METIEIICLANSRKIGGKCVAGLRVDGGGWVRPVSANETGTLLPYQCSLEDGMEARTLDLIKIPILRPLPKSHQPENLLIDENVPWRLVNRPAPRNLIHILRSHLVSGPCLFGNTYDRVPAIYFSSTPASSSLALIVPENLHLCVTTNVNDQKQVRAKFNLSGTPYNLVVTDPFWEERLKNLPFGEYPLKDIGIKTFDRVLLTISLGEPFNNNCFKLVAAIIVLPQNWRNLF